MKKAIERADFNDPPEKAPLDIAECIGLVWLMSQ